MTQVIPILLYHSIADRATGRFGPYTLARSRFADHLDYLVDQGYSTRTVSQLVGDVAAGLPLPPRTVVLTVDDGFADFLGNAWPELCDRGLSATLYVTAGLVGQRSRWLEPLDAGHLPMLDWDELRHLAGAGCEIGAHSLTHPPLDCLATAEADREIRGSKEVLEDSLGYQVPSFAYPHGFHDAGVRGSVLGAGFTSACGVRNALSHSGDDRFALARVTVLADHDVDWLHRVLTGRAARVAPSRELVRTRAWRVVRRRRYQHGHRGLVAAGR